MSDGFIERIKEMKRTFEEHEEEDEFAKADKVLLDFAYKYWDWTIEQVDRIEELENILEQDHRQEVIESLYEENIGLKQD